MKKDEQRALVQVFDKPIKGAEKIVTEYRVIEKRGAETKVEIILHTGKTHQIRAHLAHIHEKSVFKQFSDQFGRCRYAGVQLLAQVGKTIISIVDAEAYYPLLQRCVLSV